VTARAWWLRSPFRAPSSGWNGGQRLFLATPNPPKPASNRLDGSQQRIPVRRPKIPAVKNKTVLSNLILCSYKNAVKIYFNSIEKKELKKLARYKINSSYS
jgi:hypothetical protein